MPLLLFEPSLLILLLFAAGIIWGVWVRRTDVWFGHDASWTVLVWPLPGALALAPVAVGPAWFLLRSAGVTGGGEGGILGVTSYFLAALVPLTVMTLWPPRMFLPRWARDRLVAPPREQASAGALPALHIVGGRGHGSRARWAWQVDAIPGLVRVDGQVLRFRASGREADAGPVRTWLDDALAADEPTGSPDGDQGPVRLQPPRGGWWNRREVDLDLTAVDRFSVSCRRPWRRDGLVGFEVEGRGVLHLWVGDWRSLRRRVQAPLERQN